MKSKFMLGIIGVVIVIAGVIYLLNRDKTTDELETESNWTDNQKGTGVIIKYKQDSKEFFELNVAKTETAEKIHERHKEAKKW